MTLPLKDWRWWMLRLAAAMLALAFVAAHGAMLYGLASQAALPVATLASGMVILAVLKHLGLIGAVFAAIRRRFFS
jgi:hypothetical protein